MIDKLIVEIIGRRISSLSRMQGNPASIPEEINNLYRRPLTDSGNYKAPLAMMRVVAAVQ